MLGICKRVACFKKIFPFFISIKVVSSEFRCKYEHYKNRLQKSKFRLKIEHEEGQHTYMVLLTKLIN